MAHKGIETFKQVVDLAPDPAKPNINAMLSIASLWEMQIKIGLGKLTLHQPLRTVVEQQQSENGIALLGIEPRHLWALDALPQAHGDPFDRLLIAQAHCDDLSLVSRDAQFDAYPIRRVWR